MSVFKRILVVDDEKSVLFVLRDALAKIDANYEIEVHTASNGNEALHRVQETAFDMVITDLRLPGIDGLELTERVRRHNSGVAVIWITAYGCRKVRADAERLAVHRCLDKPLEIDEIRQVVREGLEHSHDQSSETE